MLTTLVEGIAAGLRRIPVLTATSRRLGTGILILAILAIISQFFSPHSRSGRSTDEE